MDDDPAHVDLFATWLYSGNIPSALPKDDGSAVCIRDNPERSTDRTAVYRSYFLFYFFAEKYGLDLLLNPAMDNIHAGIYPCDHYFKPHELEWIYRNTNASSPLRSYVTMQVAFHFTMPQGAISVEELEDYCVVGVEVTMDICDTFMQEARGTSRTQLASLSATSTSTQTANAAVRNSRHGYHGTSI